MPRVADSQFVGPEVTRGHSKETATRARLKCGVDHDGTCQPDRDDAWGLASPLTPRPPRTACRDLAGVRALRSGARPRGGAPGPAPGQGHRRNTTRNGIPLGTASTPASWRRAPPRSHERIRREGGQDLPVKESASYAPPIGVGTGYGRQE